MAKKSSTRSGRQKSQDATITPENDAETTMSGAGEMGGDTVVVGNDSLGDDTIAATPSADDSVTVKPGDTTAAEPKSDDPQKTEKVDTKRKPASAKGSSAKTASSQGTSSSGSSAKSSKETSGAGPAASGASTTTTTTSKSSGSADSSPTPPTPVPAPTPVVQKRGPGIGALLLGGVVAAAMGFGAAYLGLVTLNDTTAADAELAEALSAIEAQQGTISALQSEVDALASAEPPALPEVDLSGVEGATAEVASNLSALSETVDDLTARVVALEERPVITGDVAADTAALSEVVETLEARVAEERAAAAEAVAAAEASQAAAAAELQAAAEAAQAAIAEAEARAAATAEATQAQAALSRVQIAMAAGGPFADALSDLPVEAPEALQAAAETGVPTIDELQASFPASARAALPIALRETAGDSATDRVGAFFMGQIGGRSVEPRDGDDPDAVLSRAEAAVGAGDIDGALSEIATLPEGAQAAFDEWIAQAEARVAADDALADLSATLNN
ncbi:COG4223 family protein [Gymnodinialimonas ceratoperidinii]|uniref:Mitochondrial inner membrane protein n=1 Tax=Gymnodinialimonas ceratoperidinii TaxID=2856823 RepID=A0A8F6TWV7_9RHOB|nr:hypothetical protein [Gymnodinialimonas ceratoperidinii]QXT40145.1 hypothetical protein KYE46_02500 [Gymnodinialimonas ceratoperidinii]